MDAEIREGMIEWECASCGFSNRSLCKNFCICTNCGKTFENRVVKDQFIEDALRTDLSDEQYAQALERLKNVDTFRLLHAVIGFATEMGEFADILKKHVFYGKPIDKVNAIEELGDVSWYYRIACESLDVRFLATVLLNVEKLKARYPTKFEEALALTRDIVAERKILEEGK